MNSRVRRSLPASLAAAAAGVVLVCYAALVCAQLPLAADEDTELTADGLRRVDPSVIDMAWVRPGADLAHYKQALVMPTIVTFRDIDELPSDAMSREQDREFPIDEAAKLRLSSQFGEIFREELAATTPYELYAGVGRDVLMVRGFLLDVTSGVPPLHAGIHVNSVRWIWEASIVIELRDSMSDEVLARTYDRQRAIGPFDPDLLVEESRRVVRRWSQLLCDRLDELSGR